MFPPPCLPGSLCQYWGIDDRGKHKITKRHFCQSAANPGDYRILVQVSKTNGCSWSFNYQTFGVPSKVQQRLDDFWYSWNLLYGDHEIWWRWRPLKKSITTLLKWKPGMLMEDSFGLSWSSYLLAVLSVPNHVCAGKSLSKFYESAASRCLPNHHSNQLNSPRCH